MQHRPPHHQCLNCYEPVPALVSRYSVSQLGYTLCAACQEHLKTPLRSTSRETIKLFFSLKQRGVAVALNTASGSDNAMEIDLAEAQIHIEVDAPQSNCNPREALTELKNRFLAKKTSTVHIPNALVAYKLDETADYIASQTRTVAQ